MNKAATVAATVGGGLGVLVAWPTQATLDHLWLTGSTGLIVGGVVATVLRAIFDESWAPKWLLGPDIADAPVDEDGSGERKVWTARELERLAPHSAWQYGDSGEQPLVARSGTDPAVPARTGRTIRIIGSHRRTRMTIGGPR